MTVLVGACSSASSTQPLPPACPADLPATGGACAPAGVQCGYRRSSSECAVACGCQGGEWNCGPACSIVEVEDASVARSPPDAGVPDGGDGAGPRPPEGGADACIPKTCADYPGGTCGLQGDGCGGPTADCGPCTPPEYCGGGGPGRCGGGGPAMCIQDICVPQTCVSLDCGLAGDGCGGLLDCGTCPFSVACSSNQCLWPADAGPCVPATCGGLGYDCGAASDGCGGHLECGTCPVAQFCGGGGPHRCGGTCDASDGGAPCEITCSSADGGSCVGQSCAGSGHSCGLASNGCGGMIDCGPCGGEAGALDAPTGG